MNIQWEKGDLIDSHGHTREHQITGTDGEKNYEAVGIYYYCGELLEVEELREI